MKVIFAGGLALFLVAAFPAVSAAGDWRTHESWGFLAGPDRHSHGAYRGWSETDRYGSRSDTYGHPYSYGHRYGSGWGFGNRSPGFTSQFRFGGHGYGIHPHGYGYGKRGYGFPGYRFGHRHGGGFSFGSRGPYCDR